MQKNKFFTRLLSFILVALTVLGAVPFTAIAADADQGALSPMSSSSAVGTLELPSEETGSSVSSGFVAPTAQDIRNALGSSALMYYNDYESATAFNNGHITDLNCVGVEERLGAKHAVVSDPAVTGKVMQINTASYTNNGIQMDGFQFNLYTSVANAHRDDSTAGKSFVWSADIKLGDVISEGQLMVIRSALYGRQDAAANGGSMVFVDKSPIYLNKSGALCYGGTSSSTNAFCTLSADVYTNIALFFNVEKNYYDVYVNGELAVEKQVFLTDSDIALMKKTDSAGNYLYPAFAENGFGISQFYTSHGFTSTEGRSGTHFYLDNLTFYLGNEYVKVTDSIYDTELFEHKSTLTENKLEALSLSASDVSNHVDFEEFDIGYTVYTPKTSDSTNGIIENLMGNTALAGAGVALKCRMKDTSESGGIRIIDDGHGGKAAQLTGTTGERFFQISSVGEPATANSGKSFVISGNFKKSGTVAPGMFFPVTARHAFVTGHQDINALILFIDADGKLYYSHKDGAVLVNEWNVTNQKNASYGDSTHCIGQLSTDKFTNIAISVNVAANTFKVYIDGMAATGDLKFMPDSFQALWSTSDAYPNGFGFAYSRLAVQNIIFDDLSVVYGTAPVTDKEFFVKKDDALHLLDTNGAPVSNKTYPDGLLKTDANGAVTFSGKKISSLDEVYTVLDGQIILKNGVYSGVYEGNSLLGESGNTYCYDESKRLVVSCPAYRAGDKTYVASSRGVCTLANGIVTSVGGARYYINGVQVTAKGDLDGTYYVKDDGYLASGLTKIDGTYYFFDNYVKGAAIETATYKVINETTGTLYKNLTSALNATADGDTVTLLNDVKIALNISMPENKRVTLNLNGKNLEVKSLTAFGLTDIIDTELHSKGALITNKDSLSLPEPFNSSYLPVKNNIDDTAKSSYSFYRLENRYKLTENGDSFELLFRPSLENNATVNSTVLGAGTENNGVSISVDFTIYKSGTEPYKKSFYFDDEIVKTVYAENTKAFKATVTCREKFDAIKVCYTVHGAAGSIAMDEKTLFPQKQPGRIHVQNVGYDKALFADFDKDGVTDYDSGYTCTTSFSTVWVDVPDVDLMNYRDYHTFNFRIYSPKVSNAFIHIMPTASTVNGFHTGIRVFLNFTGWKEFSMKVDALTTTYPMPTLSGFNFTQESGTAGETFIISDIEVRREKLEFVADADVDVNDERIYEELFTNLYNYSYGTSYSKELPVYQQRLLSVNNNCKNAWDKFKSTYDTAVVNRNGLFGVNLYLPTNGRPGHFIGSDYQLTDDMVQIYTQIAYMAAGWGHKGSVYYHDAELLSDIKKALEYGYNNYYGTYILQNGTGSTNWWGWRLGTPMQLVPALVNIREGLTETEIKKYLSPFDMLLPFPIGSGSNLINMAYARVLASALEKDYRGVAIGMYYLEDIYPYVVSDQMWKGTDGGFFEDGSFIQHNNIPYHGSYGMSYLSTLPSITHLTNGTSFRTSDANILRQFEWVMDSFDHIVYGTNLMATTMGRNVGASETREYDNFLRGIVSMLPYVPNEIRDEYRAFVKEHMIRRGSSFSLIVSPVVSPYAEELWNDDSVLPRDLVGYTKVFGSMARIVQHGPKYGVCIALSSTKVSKYESINGANETGWYHGDGMVYLYTYDADYDSRFFFYANPYLMPGTTVNSAVRKRVTHTAQNKSDFAGGVSQGLFGASGFILEYDWIRSQGTFANQSDASIKAKKSYFMFDDELVCIGSGISDASGTTVKTVVENRLWHQGQMLYIDGNEVEVSGKSFQYYNSNNNNLVNNLTYVAAGARSMHFTGMGGYIFLGDSTVRYDKTTYSGSATQGTLADETKTDTSVKHTFLEITIDHGKNPSGGKYAYIYLPESTLDKTNAYALDPDVKVLSDSNTVHAALETKIGALGAVFYAAGTLTVNESSSPVTRIYASNGACVIVSTNENGETVISVSDPTNSLSSLSFEIDVKNAKSIKSFDDGVSGATITSAGKLRFTVNTTDSCGKTFSVTVA